MTDDLVFFLRNTRLKYMTGDVSDLPKLAADRIEQLEAALKHIWAFYPVSVSNPRETIDAIKDFAFNALKEK